MKDFILTLVVIVALMALFAACGGSQTDPVAPKTESIPGEGLYGEVYKVTLDGMPCLVWVQEVYPGSKYAYANSGLTCDWGVR